MIDTAIQSLFLRPTAIDLLRAYGSQPIGTDFSALRFPLWWEICNLMKRGIDIKQNPYANVVWLKGIIVIRTSTQKLPGPTLSNN